MSSISGYGSKILVCCAILGVSALFAGAAWGSPAQEPNRVIELPEVVISIDPCEEFAELHYAMAESVGFEGPELDAAFEDAYSACAGRLSYQQAQRDFQVEYASYCAAGGVKQVAGGWVAFCEES